MPFGNAVGEGFVNGSIVVANKVIVTGPGDGMFVFNPSEAPGNLIVSVTADAGTIDGNTYLEGLVSYVKVSGQVFALQIGNQGAGGVAFFIHNMTNPPNADPGYSANLASPSGCAAEIVSGKSAAGSGEAVLLVEDSVESGIPGGAVDVEAGALLFQGSPITNLGTPTGYPVSTDPNSGSTWVSGERAFINTWPTCLNSLISMLLAAQIL